MMTRHHYERIVIDVLIVICVIQAWWFVAAVCALYGTWRHRLFIEVIIAGFMYDSLFGHSFTTTLWSWIGTMSGSVCFLLIHWLKNLLRK